MMPKFSIASKKQLASCDPRLQKLFNEVIKYFDFTIVEGHRGREAQEAAFAKGLSKVHWPHGKHNSYPSHAVDIAPYPIDWSDKVAAHQRFVLLAGFVLCIAKQLGIQIRWGGDWDMNLDTRGEGLRDLPHFELHE